MVGVVSSSLAARIAFLDSRPLVRRPLHVRSNRRRKPYPPLRFEVGLSKSVVRHGGQVRGRDSRREELAQVRRQRREAARARREALRRGERPDREQLRAALIARRTERQQERRQRRQERRTAVGASRPTREQARTERATLSQTRVAARKHRQEYRRAKQRLSRRATPAPSRIPRVVAAGFVGIAAVTGLLAGSWTEEGEGRSDPAPAESTAAGADAAQARYAEGLETALARLSDRRERPLKRLRSAKAPGEQAAALEALAAQHRSTARELRALPDAGATGRSSAAVLAALTAAGKGYERMAQAASRRQSSTYEAATDDVRASEARLQRAVRRMRSQS